VSKSHRDKKNKNLSKKPSSLKKYQEKVSIPRARIIAGVHTVKAAFSIRPDSIMECWYSERWSDEDKEFAHILEIGKKHGVVFKSVKSTKMNQVVQVHQGLLAFLNDRPRWNRELSYSKKSSIIVALDDIVDPHNIGAILRTSWLMGADVVIGVKSKGAGLVPSAAKVSCGGSESIAYEEVVNLSRELEDLKKQGYWVYGLAGEARESLSKVNFAEKVVIVVGSEDKGIRPLNRKNCDELIKIEQVANDASYNASVATAICLYEVKKQLSLK
jgi:23S rRNA (guanosine2251-2'-O)-methyltransferase